MAGTAAAGDSTTVRGRCARVVAIGAVAMALGASLLGPTDAAARATPKANKCNELSYRIDVAVDNALTAAAAGDLNGAKFYDQQATVLGREYQALGC